ncbi:serine/threonine-protein phosphatase [Actinospica durhamensis]|uniref:Serine/threonine-protein phosphatase n=1 Tax=Actinospica durhamensis TaxID=1508375 RepID=A0A941IUM9_9ACTN|nr:PP2C family protein-serine/threonine phosphatase [Actinospica durhamensis]MBR7835766.1 serine/threonine-protein phosphatase [Actinospica durhamensis]
MQRDLAVERALDAADPDRLVDVLRSALREQYGAAAVELRLADYAIHSLQPARPDSAQADPIIIDGTAQGRAFGSQEPVVAESAGEDRVLHLPVTHRGDRVGVLSVTVPAAACAPPMLDELRRISTVTAREIILAARETDRYEVGRRAERLTLAAEMQWLLLPARSCTRPEFSLGAHLEPAYAIYGDGFDWSVSGGHLTVAVINGMGQGVNAALLTALVVAALRNARRAGLSLADQAVLADEAVFSQHRGKAHVEALLVQFELATGRVEVVDAGSPRLWRVRGDMVEPRHLDAQMPLGMFGDTDYRMEPMRVEPGDRLVIVGDGVYAAASPTGEKFEQRALAHTITATRSLPPAQVPTAVLHALLSHYGQSPLLDDAVVACVDWHGPRSAEGEGESEDA